MGSPEPAPRFRAFLTHHADMQRDTEVKDMTTITPQRKGGLCRAMKAYAGNTLLCTRDRGHPDGHQCGAWSWR